MNEKPHTNGVAAQNPDEAFWQSVFIAAGKKIVVALEEHKAKHGMNMIDETMTAHALIVFADMLSKNKLLAKGEKVDHAVNIAINAIAKGASAARKRVENKRIISLR